MVEIFSGPKGYGIKAIKNYDEDDIIFEENPIVCAQFLHNKDFFLACSHCMRSLEKPSAMLKRLSGIEVELPSHFDPALSDLNQPQIFSCQHCSDVYCSEHCQQEAYQQYHHLLCNNPFLLQLENEWKECHLPPESASIMLVVRLIAILINRMNQGLDTFDIINRFKMDTDGAVDGMG